MGTVYLLGLPHYIFLHCDLWPKRAQHDWGIHLKYFPDRFRSSGSDSIYHQLTGLGPLGQFVLLTQFEAGSPFWHNWWLKAFDALQGASNHVNGYHQRGLGSEHSVFALFFLHRIRRKLNLKIQTKKVCTFTSLQNQLTSHMEFVIVLLNSDCSICVCDRSKSSSLKGGQPRNVTGVGILDMYRARFYGCFLAIHIDHLHQQMV